MKVGDVVKARPANCTMRLRAEGKPAPKSGCESCGNGGLFGCPHDGSRREGAPPPTKVDGVQTEAFVMFMCHCRYRDNSERFKTFSFPESTSKAWLVELGESLNAAPKIREFYVGHVVVRGHKSFDEDFTPDALRDAVEVMTKAEERE